MEQIPAATPTSLMMISSAVAASTLQFEEPDPHEHMFERKRHLPHHLKALYRKFSESYCMSLVLSYLGQR
jgi:hypothetical protein